jgi:hypothetical protein
MSGRSSSRASNPTAAASPGDLGSPESTGSSPGLGSFEDLASSSPESQPSGPGLPRRDPRPSPPRGAARAAPSGPAPRGPPPVETVDPREEEDFQEEYTPTPSDRDGALSEASSAGESLPGTSRPLETIDLVDLQGQDKCRQIYVGTLMDGTKTRVCCGRTITECRQHAKKRLAGKDRGLPRWYLKAATARGASVHGLSGENSFTQAEYEGILAAEAEELSAAARDLEEGSDSEAEVEVVPGLREARAPTLVNFGGATTFQTPPRPRGSRDSTRASYSGASVEGLSAQIARLVQEEVAKAAVASAGPPDLGPRRSFRPGTDEVVSIDEGSLEDGEGSSGKRRPARKPVRHARAKPHAPEWVGLHNPVGQRILQKESKDGSFALKPGWKVLKYFSDQASGRRWLRPVGDSSGPSSSSSSDSDESSSSSSSSSSSDTNWLAPAAVKKNQRLAQKKHSTKQKKKKGSKKKKSTGRKSSYRGTDPSTGDEKRIHGFEVDGVKMDKALAPPDLAARDRISLVETAVDVAALPGMFSASSLASDEVQGVTEAATSMLATISGKRAQLHDSQWKVRRKNSLGNVKTDTDLLALLESVEEAWVPANEQQASKLRSFLYARYYDMDQVTDYLEHGLLPTLILRTYEYFVSLLAKVRQLYYAHRVWEGGPAQAMLDYHAKKLASVRAFSCDYRSLVLKTYVHLRDAADKKFYHASQQEALWSRVTVLEHEHPSGPPKPGGLGGPGTPGPPRCSHCRSGELHVLLGLPAGKPSCPLIALKHASAELKAATKKVLDSVKAHPDGAAARVLIAELTRPAPPP